MKPEDLIGLMQSAGDPSSPFRLGKVDPAYAAGRPKIVFDGEAAASTRTYPYLSSYTPAANDRVLLAIVNAGAVVIGKIL